MRVLVITNIYPSPVRPWLGTFVEQQVQGLQSIGVQVRVLYFDRKQDGPLVYYRMDRRIDEAVAEFVPHLIHIMYGGVMAHQITRRSWSVPVVVTFHGSDLLGENLSGRFRRMVSHYGVRCSRTAARQASGVVVVARHLLEALPSTFPRPSDGSGIQGEGLDQPSTLNPEKGRGHLGALRPQPSTLKVRIIPCGIDLDRFQPMDRDVCRQKLGWALGAFHVLFPANTGDPVKRPWLAQAAVEMLRDRGVPAVLHLLSGVPYADVPLWMNASDVLILTSLHEGSPTVVKEALACNVPVVSVEVGDVRERLAGIAGCFLALAEPEDLARKLFEVHQRQSRVDGRKAVQCLSSSVIAERLKSFYCELLSDPEARLDPASTGVASPPIACP